MSGDDIVPIDGTMRTTSLASVRVAGQGLDPILSQGYVSRVSHRVELRTERDGDMFLRAEQREEGLADRNVGDGRGTESASRVAEVLLAFLDGPRARGVSAIARELGLSKAVVHRILQTLVATGLLQWVPATREYRLGASAGALGARALRDSDLRTVAMPVLRDLQHRTRETTTVSARVAGGRVYLDQVPSDREIKMTVEVGRRFPLHAGSSSLSILAFVPIADREDTLAGELVALTPRTASDPAVLRSRLAEIRRVGYAFSGGERQVGAGAVAAPVFGVDGRVVGAISVCGPGERLDQAARDQYAPLLRAAAEKVSRGLGWRGGLPEEDGVERR